MSDSTLSAGTAPAATPAVSPVSAASANSTTFAVILSLSFCHLLNDMMQSLVPALYPILKENYALSFGQVGLITLAFQCTASMLQPLVGLYTDKKPQPYSLMTVLESVLVARAYHFNQPRAEVIADATQLARLFGLPGLPAGRRETTPTRALVRAACVRGFIGSPDLIVVQDQVLDQSSELAVPMAQAISAACDRGATVLWITASLATQAAQFVQPHQQFRLGDHGLMRVRRSR